MHATIRFGLTATCTLILTLPAAAQQLGTQDFAPSPIVQVHAPDTGAQSNPAVGIAEDGTVLVVWEHNGDLILGRRYDSRMNPLAGEFQVSAGTYNNTEPELCVDENGDFVAVWERSSFYSDIKMRRSVGGSLAPDNTDATVNTESGMQPRTEPSVDCQNAGDFVVAWQGPTVDDGNAIAARRFQLGVGQGAEFRVNTNTADPNSGPQIKMDQAGNFVVAWDQGTFDSDGGRGGEPLTSGLATRRFDASAVALDTDQIHIAPSSYNGFTLDRSKDNGNFVVVWQGYEPGTGTLTQGELFSPQGSSLASLQLLPAGSWSSGLDALAAFAGPDGSFLISSHDPDSPLTNFQRFDAAGMETGATWLGQQAAGRGSDLDIAGHPDGSFVVTWSAYQTPGYGADVFVQSWHPALFADGFEAGDSSEWTSQTP